MSADKWGPAGVGADGYTVWRRLSRASGSAGDPGGSVRYTSVEQPGYGVSPYRSHQRFFGASWFCTPGPQDRLTPEMLRDPDDPFKAGKRLLDQMWAGGYAPWVNYSVYNFNVFPIDTSRPEGAWEEGGGGYKMGKMWQRQMGNGPQFHLMRGYNGMYQDKTQNVPIPFPRFAPAPGTDGSACVIDFATKNIYDYWILRQQTATTGYVTANYYVEQRTPIPIGEWTYPTCAITYNCVGKLGGHDYGNVSAAGVWGAAIQLGIDEMLAWCGLELRNDGTYKRIQPQYDACQHVLGLEFPVSVAESGFIPPACMTDGNNPSVYGTRYGHRLVLDKATRDSILNDPTKSDMLKGFVNTMYMYGGMGTDRSGSLAIRGEPYVYDRGSVNPWDYAFKAQGYKNGAEAAPDKFMLQFPWDKIMSLAATWKGTPIGLPRT